MKLRHVTSMGKFKCFSLQLVLVQQRNFRLQITIARWIHNYILLHSYATFDSNAIPIPSLTPTVAWYVIALSYCILFSFFCLLAFSTVYIRKVNHLACAWCWSHNIATADYWDNKTAIDFKIQRVNTDQTSHYFENTFTRTHELKTECIRV